MISAAHLESAEYQRPSASNSAAVRRLSFSTPPFAPDDDAAPPPPPPEALAIFKSISLTPICARSLLVSRTAPTKSWSTSLLYASKLLGPPFVDGCSSLLCRPFATNASSNASWFTAAAADAAAPGPAAAEETGVPDTDDDADLPAFDLYPPAPAPAPAPATPCAAAAAFGVASTGRSPDAEGARVSDGVPVLFFISASEEKGNVAP